LDLKNTKFGINKLKQIKAAIIKHEFLTLQVANDGHVRKQNHK